MDTLKSLLSPENMELATQIVVAVLAVIGGLSLLVRAMSKTLVPLKRLAASTATTKDDAAVEAFSIFLGVSAACLEKAKSFLELLAFSRGRDEQIVKVERVK